MKLKPRLLVLLVTALFCLSFIGCDDSEITSEDNALSYMKYLSETIGKRPAGTANEGKARDYIAKEFEKLGYEVTIQPFSFVRKEVTINSNNVIAVLPGESEKQVIVGGHYDSVSQGLGNGASDNASAIAIMFVVADNLPSKLPYTLKFIAFGAEELGLKGSEYYVSQMKADEIANTIGMINLDTLVGGDKIYVYGGAGSGGWIRDQALNIAKSRGIDLQTNPGLNPEYPVGTTGDWSDHAPFVEKGITYAYFESTNWEIGDLDGYMQTVKDGEIWHTDKDTIQYIESAYPGRIEYQLSAFIDVITELLYTLKVPAVMPRAGKPVSGPIHKTTRNGLDFD